MIISLVNLIMKPQHHYLCNIITLATSRSGSIWHFCKFYNLSISKIKVIILTSRRVVFGPQWIPIVPKCSVQGHIGIKLISTRALALGHHTLTRFFGAQRHIRKELNSKRVRFVMQTFGWEELPQLTN